MFARAAALAVLITASALPAAADDEASQQALATELHMKIAQCWAVPVDLPAHVQAVRVKFSLTGTGALDGSPSVEGAVAGDPATKAFAASAVRAVVRCAPYDVWKTVVVTFRRPEF